MYAFPVYAPVQWKDKFRSLAGYVVVNSRDKEVCWNKIDIDKNCKLLLKATNKCGYEFRLKCEAKNPFLLNISSSKDHHHNIRLFCCRNAAIEAIVKDLSDVNHSELIPIGNYH